jgi:ubiquinone/menaquinone biosynthesis C-methylase UbiE
MSSDNSAEIRKTVRDQYGQVALGRGSCCEGAAATPCGCGGEDGNQIQSRALGYSEEQMADVPEGANLGLGCGNPVALAALDKGQTVLDLGAGAGFDCFLAARAVGPDGRVIGVDMTAEMIDKARRNAQAGGYANVEFRLGEIEHLPVADSAVDVVISNCVINLSPDKPRVFAEALRVLRPGGRLMIADIVLLRPLPEDLLNSAAAYVGCVAGAVMRDDYLAMLRTAGFEDVSVEKQSAFGENLPLHDPLVQSILKEARLTPEQATDAGRSVVSVQVSARKPVGSIRTTRS